MSAGKKKLGRPAANESRETMTKVTFLLDAETNEAFEELGAAAGPKIRGWRSILLRRLILTAAGKLSD